MFITAVKANQACKSERQNLSLLRSTPIGKYIEPEIAKDAAVSLVDCFQRLYLNLYQGITSPPKPNGEKLHSIASKAVKTVKNKSTNM